jgi:hypothetical protein
MTDVSHPSDICQLADTVAELVTEKLGQSVISSSFPAHIGDMIRDACQSQQIQQVSQLYLRGPYAIATYWILSPDGTVTLEMRDHMGQPFWRGTFRPAEASSD